MKKGTGKIYLKTAGLGIISGMRATIAPTIVAHFLGRHTNAAVRKSKLSFIQSPAASVITKVLSVAEIAGDKIPGGPNRTTAPQVIARVASGAMAGAVISTANKDNVVKGILIGGISALAATFATFYIRKYISKSTVIKEPLTGVLEDAVAVGSGILLMNI